MFGLYPQTDAKTSQTTFTSCMHDQMLESNRDDVKLEAMRCVTVMTAKGKLTVPRTLFPHIVKNVSSKNPELKKLIYLYLTSFADQEPDLALLPVATLQKSLKSPNPLIRSSALKVLTSMRLSILSAILMATLRNSVNDLSPYVRKTVAHSIIKIYRLEPNLRADLIEYIERLFSDKNSMVLSSTVASFEIVCPERLDLVHKQYRRFCFILADCNEWGQTLLLRLLTRYVLRTLKLAENGELQDYNPSEHDPKILLRSARPLIHSHSSAVVLSVVMLYINAANFNEVRSTITKPLIRLLHSHREIQLTALKIIDDLTDLGENNIRLAELQGYANTDQLECVEPNSENLGTETIKIEQKDLDAVVADLEVKQSAEPNASTSKDGYIALDAEDGQSIDSNLPATTTMNDDLENVAFEPGDTENNCTEQMIQPDKNPEDDGNAGADKTSDVEKTAESDDGESQDTGSDESDDEDEDESESESGSEGSESDSNDSSSSKNDEKLNASIKKPVVEFNWVDLSENMSTSSYREVFRPYVKSFFIQHHDCTLVRLAKLKILTNLCSPVNVTHVLRELQAYVATYAEDREFVSASIQAIGRCALIVKEVAPTCLNGLTSLLSNNNEHVVSEAIVVLRSQIMSKESPIVESDKTPNNDEPAFNDSSLNGNGISDDKIVSTVIKQVTMLLPTITAPQARATILWILAEFCGKNITAAKCTPNVLRSIAKTFCEEDNFVKLQSLTLVAKFLLSLDKEKKSNLRSKVQLLAGYFFNLAKYDINHDVRDRGRFLKKLLEEEEVCAKVLSCCTEPNTALKISSGQELTT